MQKCSVRLNAEHPLKIDTEEKQKYVEEHMDLKKYFGYTTFYLDAEKNGTSWVWSDGSGPFNRGFFWAPGQPNNSAAKAIRVISDEGEEVGRRIWDIQKGIQFVRGLFNKTDIKHQCKDP